MMLDGGFGGGAGGFEAFGGAAGGGAAPAPNAASSSSSASLQTVDKIRNIFPETWLWNMAVDKYNSRVYEYNDVAVTASHITSVA